MAKRKPRSPIEDELDLPNMEDVMKLQEDTVSLDEEEEDMEVDLSNVSEEDIDNLKTQITQRPINEPKGDMDVITASDIEALDRETDADLDTIYDQAMESAYDVMDVGHNSPPNIQSEMFNSSNNFLNTALTTRNSKIAKKLKMAKLSLEFQKLELMKRKAGENVIQADTVQSAAVITDNRNAILEEMRAKLMQKDK
jgi:hypothetical protein